MIIQHNIDRNDEYEGSKYPFSEDSTLELGSSKIAFRLLTGVRIQLPVGLYCPCRISRFVADVSALPRLFIYIADGRGTEIGRASMPKFDRSLLLSAIVSDQGLLRGTVAYNPRIIPDLLLGLLCSRGSEIESHVLELRVPDDGFVVRPELHSVLPEEHATLLMANGNTLTGDYSLDCGIGVHNRKMVDDTDVPPEDLPKLKIPVRYGMSGPFDPGDGKDGIRTLSIDAPVIVVNGKVREGSPVNGLHVGGAHLILRHSVESNLRVRTGDGDDRAVILGSVCDE